MESLTGAGNPRERCFETNWHPAHTWTRGGVEVECDGMTTSQPRAEPEGPCCGDPNCPCQSKPNHTRSSAAGSMNYDDL